MLPRWALESERRLCPDTQVLEPGNPTTAKTLLTRPTRPSLQTRDALTLTPIATEADWRLYERLRIEVEAGFGVPPHEAREMVTALRGRSARLGLTMLFGRTIEDEVVAAVGHFGEGAWSRLQEVDVFPAWRGRGYGDALLSAILLLLADQGAKVAIVGADEDDWPLGWYRRRGFTDVARVPLSR